MRNKRLHTRLAKRGQVSDFARFLCMSRQGLYKALKQEKRNLWVLYARYARERFMLGKKVYYLKMTEKDANVYDGVVVAESITDDGYRSYSIKTKDGLIEKESAYVYADKELAKAAFDVMWPKAKKMYEILSNARKECDAIRDDLLGEPEFPEFVEKEDEKQDCGNN